MTRCWRLVPAAIVATAACTSWEAARPVVTAVVPAIVVLDVPTAVTIEGRRFRNDLEASLDGSGTQVDDVWTASVAGVALTAVVRVNDTALSAVVPGGVPLGVHDLEVFSPAGRRAVLPAGLTVVEENVVTGEVTVASVEVPGGVVPDQQWARVTVLLANTFARSLPLVGARLGFLNIGSDVGDDYGVYADTRNPVEVAALSSAQLVFWVNVHPGADGFGEVDVIATARAALSTSGEFADVEGAGSWLLADENPPVLALTPLSPGDRTRCLGESVTVGVAGTGSAFTWSFENGTPASVAGTSASASWNEPGAWFYTVTGTNLLAVANTRRALDPVLVGELSEPPSKTHVAGPLLFDRPLVDEALDIGTLASGDELLASQLLAQCDGTPLPGASSNAYVTVFVDRGVLVPDEDDRSGVGGVQRFLVADAFPATTIGPGSPALEGAASLYAETRDSDDRVTGAAWIPFSFTGDVDPPSVVESIPVADCPGECLAPGDAMWFRMSEPIDVASLLTGVSVTWSAGAMCSSTSGFSATTAAVTWDEASWTLALVPPVVGPAATFAVRAELDVADTSVAANPLASTLCAVYGGAAAPVPPAPAAVLVDLLRVSPDGDEDDDAAVFGFDAGDGARRARLEIWRDFRRIAAVVRGIDGAGTWTLAWDGRDGDGRVVRDGWVEWRLTLESAAGSPSPAVAGILQLDSGVGWVGPPFPVP